MTDAAAMKSDLMRTLVERGYLYQATDVDGLDARAASGPVSGYIGFDLTATSLHVGSLVQIMMLRRLQQAGHTPIILMGGATTKIGDPSGRDASRPLLTAEDIQANLDGILKPFARLIDLDRALVVNNDDWLAGYGYLDFLREYGTHFTINRMMAFDSVKLRLEREQPLTFLEFNYMLLQAVDFLELNRRHGCALDRLRPGPQLLPHRADRSGQLLRAVCRHGWSGAGRRTGRCGRFFRAGAAWRLRQAVAGRTRPAAPRGV